MKKLILIILTSTIIFSCNERLEEMNQPEKNATAVPAETLFANGVREMHDLMASSDVNSDIFRLLSQYWAQTTYPDESQYNLVSRLIPDNFWTFAYRDVLRDLTQARKRVIETSEELSLSEKDVNTRLAIIDVNRAYMYATLVDVFGAVPFSEAINDTIYTPEYEAGPVVYEGAIAMLDGAIKNLDSGGSGFPASQDPIYEGSVEGWKKFANSLKLKLAINIADVNPAKATAMVSEIAEADLILDNSDNASITYQATSPNNNPVWDDLVASGRSDFVVSNTFINKLTSLNDPRIAVFAEPVSGNDYVGGVYGSGNSFADFSHIGEAFHEATLEGVIMDAAFVNFLLAEAVERGLWKSGTAESYYNNAITSSMQYWGINDQATISNYLSRSNVAYGTAAGDWKQKIGIQSWIASFNSGIEGWNTWRRLDFTGFNVPKGLTANDIPKRFFFPIEEATLNPTNYKAAVQLIGGSDDVQTKVCWDVK